MASGSCFVRRTEFFRTASFRWTIAFATILVVAIGLLTGFIYWQTTRYLIGRVDRELQEFAQQPGASNPGSNAGSNGPLQSFLSRVTRNGGAAPTPVSR